MSVGRHEMRTLSVRIKKKSNKASIIIKIKIWTRHWYNLSERNLAEKAKSKKEICLYLKFNAKNFDDFDCSNGNPRGCG